MERFVKIVSSILHVWQGSEYISERYALLFKIVSLQVTIGKLWPSFFYTFLFQATENLKNYKPWFPTDELHNCIPLCFHFPQKLEKVKAFDELKVLSTSRKLVTLQTISTVSHYWEFWYIHYTWYIVIYSIIFNWFQFEVINARTYHPRCLIP